jgi:3-oxo-5-alpha-steroid 4-dehydrogenase 1
MSINTLQVLTGLWILIALIVHVTMFYVTAPFGRHSSEKWGLQIDNKLGWMLMELPSLLIMTYYLGWGSHSFSYYAWVLFGLWILHYFHRSLIYPLRIKATPKKMPLVIAMSAILFNSVNASLNGYYLAELAPQEKYSQGWLSSPHFLLGIILFIVGFAINLHSDTILINLRKPGETSYKIPRGFLFTYVSSPNLFGEIIEWTGFAVMAWNLPALSFMVWTFANLVPRAKNHHDWYLQHFSDYPKERKIVFPFLY